MIVYDTTHDPLHVMVYPRFYEYAELDRMHCEIEEHFRARVDSTKPVALISDLRVAPAMDARARRRVAQCFGRLAPMIDKVVVGHALVLRGRLARGALTAILWVQTPPWDMQTFATLEEGDRWLRRRFERAHLPPPSAPPGWWNAAVTRAHVSPAKAI